LGLQHKRKGLAVKGKVRYDRRHIEEGAMTHRELSSHRLALTEIIEVYFKEGSPVLQEELFYLEASPFLFPIELTLDISLYRFRDFLYGSSYGLTNVFVFAGDDHRIPRLHPHYQRRFADEVKDFHKMPTNPNIDVNWEIRWRMERVCNLPKKKIWNHYIKGLAVAIFLHTGPVSFHCLPVVFPDPPLPKEKAILRKAKI